MKPVKNLLKHILEHLDMSGEHWLWKRKTTIFGHGQLKYKRKMRLVHRLMWEFTRGPIPQGMCVCHKCDIPQCCKPTHLFIGSHSDNARDKVRKGRDNTAKKLTRAKVKQIATLLKLGTPQKVLSEKFNVSISTISLIKNKKVWRFVLLKP